MLVFSFSLKGHLHLRAAVEYISLSSDCVAAAAAAAHSTDWIAHLSFFFIIIFVFLR